MSSSIDNISSSYLQSILSSACQSAGLPPGQANISPGGINPKFVPQQDKGDFSSFAQVMVTLQQLQQSDPAKYQQVTEQIATNLQDAAQAAQSEGNTTAANQLNQLASDFTNVSKNAQLPNIQDLAQAIGGHHHYHHHHFHAAPADSAENSSAGSSSTSASSSTASQPLSQLVSAYQANGAQSGSRNPMSIILETLSNAGINGSN
jgi:hypothetical protein